VFLEILKIIELYCIMSANINIYKIEGKLKKGIENCEEASFRGK